MPFSVSGPKTPYDRLALFGVKDQQYSKSGWYTSLAPWKLEKGSLKDPKKTLDAIRNIVFPMPLFSKMGPSIRFATTLQNALSDDLREDPDFIAQLALAIKPDYPRVKKHVLRIAERNADKPGRILEALKSRDKRRSNDDTMNIDVGMDSMTDALDDIIQEDNVIDGIASLATG